MNNTPLLTAEQWYSKMSDLTTEVGRAWLDEKLNAGFMSIVAAYGDYVKQWHNDSAMYVWLDTGKGSFSNSWDHKSHSEDLVKRCAPLPVMPTTWKLIKFNCINDEAFEFTNKMKLR